MDSPVNGDVARAISKLFASERDSDCVIIFYRDRNDPNKVEAPAKRRRLGDGSPSTREVLGDPLPGHLLVLRYASEVFAAQVKWMTENASSNPATAAAAAAGCGGGGRGLQLHVPLHSKEELPAARAAIAFAYTGRVQVEGGGVRRVLEVRQQGAYLQMPSCAAACDEQIVQWLQAANTGGDPDQQLLAAVLELYACSDLWPDPQAEPGFTAVLDAARSRLAAHFRNAPAALNEPQLRAQLLALPATCVVALLESEEFGTDSESSVLLLLATWVVANRPDARVRRVLCRRLRLLHLSRPYPHLVLPALAADHEAAPDSPAGWFPMSVLEAAFLCGLTTAPELELSPLLSRNPFQPLPAAAAAAAASADGDGNDVDDTDDQSAWCTYKVNPRPQCIPAGAGGLSFPWQIKQQTLERALADLPTGKQRRIFGTFGGGGVQAVSAWGFEWMAGIRVIGGQPSAGLYVQCRLPPALAPPGSRLGVLDGKSVAAVSTRLRLSVVRWQEGKWEDLVCSACIPFLLTTSAGFDGAMPLRLQQQHKRAGGRAGGGGGAGGGLLAAWADYLRAGKIRGVMTLNPLAVS